MSATVTGRSTNPMGHVLWSTTRGDYVWFGPGSRLGLIFGDSLVTIEHPTADGSYESARDARAALGRFLASFSATS
jgi:hypothetical protein